MMLLSLIGTLGFFGSPSERKTHKQIESNRLLLGKFIEHQSDPEIGCSKRFPHRRTRSSLAGSRTECGSRPVDKLQFNKC